MFALLKKHNGRSRRSFGSIITIIVTSCQGAREVQWFETVNDPLEPVLLLTRTACLRMTSPCLFQLRRSEPSPSSSCYRFKAKQSQQTARVKSGCADDVDQDRDAHSMLEILDDDDPDRPYVRVHGYYSWDPVPNKSLQFLHACWARSLILKWFFHLACLQFATNAMPALSGVILSPRIRAWVTHANHAISAMASSRWPWRLGLDSSPLVCV